jgi:heterodisulfide reductase subunit C
MVRVAETRTFLDEISAIPGGEGIRVCIQCGTCTASCPNAHLMDHTPSELIAMARAGLKKEVLSSNAMWYCLSCYMCTVRCPRGIKQTGLMHAFESLSIQHGYVQTKTLTPTMYRLFNHYCTLGNLPELWFMTRFYLTTNPLRAWRMIPLAYDLLRRGRLSVKSRKLTEEGSKQLQEILAKAKTLGGAG